MIKERNGFSVRYANPLASIRISLEAFLLKTDTQRKNLFRDRDYAYASPRKFYICESMKYYVIPPTSG